MYHCVSYISAIVSLFLAIPIETLHGKTLPLDISSGVAHDFNLDKENNQIHVEKNDINIGTYAWNTFFALNFPSYPIDSGRRGIADPSKSFGDPGPTVWNTFKQKRELFRIMKDPRTSTGFSYSTTPPGSFHDLIPFAEMSPNINPCEGVIAVTPKEVWNFADEAQEIGLATIWTRDAVPTKDNLVYTQVKMNKAYFDYVSDNQLYYTVQLNYNIGLMDQKRNYFGNVRLPIGNQSSEGALLVKSSWVKKTALPESFHDQYYTVKGMYYDNENNNICYRTDDFSLIGIHFIHKTESLPTFLYTSFDNIHNPEISFFYANTVGELASPINPSTLPNAFGVPYCHPEDPQAGLQHPPYPVQYQLNPIRPVIQQLNKEAQELMIETNPNAVWKNYQLVGLQFQPANGPRDFVNQSQDYYLANPVIETSQRFQKFTGTFTLSDHTNILPQPYGQTSVVQMGGCAGCHGAGAQGGAYTQDQVRGGKGGTDFSFILFAVRFNPQTQGVETIKDAVDQITPGTKYMLQPWFTMTPSQPFFLTRYDDDHDFIDARLETPLEEKDLETDLESQPLTRASSSATGAPGQLSQEVPPPVQSSNVIDVVPQENPVEGWSFSGLRKWFFN